MPTAACGNCQHFERILNNVGVCYKLKEKTVQMLAFDHCDDWKAKNNA